MVKTYPQLSVNLKRLLFERDMKPTDLARALHIPQPTIHRLVAGKSKRPYKSSLLPIADYFSITVAQLLGEKPLPNQQLSKAQMVKEASNTSLIPLISWKLAADPKNAIKSKEYHGQLIVTDMSVEAFALIMLDSSMEPLFPRGTILIFDPALTPKDRSYVLVKLHDSDLPVFRQLLIDADHQYLKPLNPDLSKFNMRSLRKDDRILSSLMESRSSYKPEGDEDLINES